MGCAEVGIGKENPISWQGLSGFFWQGALLLATIKCVKDFPAEGERVATSL